MSITTNKIKVWFEDNQIFLKTESGEIQSHPLNWFPKLLNASEEERNDFDISPFGIHWGNIDEDLSFDGFTGFKK